MNLAPVANPTYTETDAQVTMLDVYKRQGCAVAASLAAVEGGARMVQGTYVGFGERCGNANLSTVLPTLQLKMGHPCVEKEQMARLTKTARIISDVANLTLPDSMPYVGGGAFSHKAGMHVDAVHKNSRTFEHISPDLVGNKRHILILSLIHIWQS